MHFLQPWMAQERWCAIRSAVDQTVEELNKLSIAMIKEAERHRANCASNQPTATESWSSFTITFNDESKEVFAGNTYAKAIVDCFIEKSNYEWMNINDLIPKDALPRHRFVSQLIKCGLFIKDDCSLVLYTHSYGNNIESLRFAWLVPANSEDRDADRHRSVQRACEESVPVYHSRNLKRQFIELAESMDLREKAKLRRLYVCATGDAAAARTSDEQDVDNRLLQFLELGDASIVYDLRALNHRPKHYEEFFNAAEKFIAESIESSVDDRRHDSVVHLAKAISASDLHK